MRICCVSDLHGYLPEIPDCDAVLLAGDIVPTYCHDVPNARGWLDTNFRGWLDGLRDRDIKVVGIAGNHDFVFERNAVVFADPLPWIYLQDSASLLEQEGVYGSPHTPFFHNWAFNLYEDELKKKWDLIPCDLDFLVVHGPPNGCGDYVQKDKRHVGSTSLRDSILSKRPSVVVCGHIHSGYGVYELGSGIVINAAYVGEDYKPANKPVIFDYINGRVEMVTPFPA